MVSTAIVVSFIYFICDINNGGWLFITKLACFLSSARKNANDLKDALESVVVPMFCNASIGANDEQKHKLEKLLKLWESKANYLASDTVEKMHQPAVSYQQYQAEQVNKYANEVANLAQQTKATFEGYRAQHQAFVCHAMQQIMDLQQQKQNLEQQQPPPTTTNIIPLDAIQANLQQTIQSISQSNNTSIPPPPNPPPLPQNQFSTQPPPTAENFMPPIDPSVPPPNMAPQQPPPNGMDGIPFNQPPPGFFPTPGVFPDFSKPPPGFPPPPAVPQPELEDLTPSVPYYDLPAGLMVPLIKVSLLVYEFRRLLFIKKIAVLRFNKLITSRNIFFFFYNLQCNHYF